MTATEVTYTLTEQEFRRFVQWMSHETHHARMRHALLAALLVILFVLFWGLFRHALAALVAVIVCAGLVYTARRSTLRSAFRHSGIGSRPRTVKISDAGIRVEDGVSSSDVEWTSGITNIDDALEFIRFAFAAGHSIVIPKRAFSSAAQADLFVGAARQWWNAARGAGGAGNN